MFSGGLSFTVDRVNENSTLQHAYDVQLCSDSARRLALAKEPAFSTPTDKLIFLMLDPHSPVCSSKLKQQNAFCLLNQFGSTEA